MLPPTPRSRSRPPVGRTRSRRGGLQIPAGPADPLPVTAAGRQVSRWERERAMEPAQPAQRAHLRRVFDALGEPTFLLSVEPGPRYVIVAANEQGQALIGMEESEIVGLSVDELMPPETHEQTI